MSVGLSLVLTGIEQEMAGFGDPRCFLIDVLDTSLKLVRGLDGVRPLNGFDGGGFSYDKRLDAELAMNVLAGEASSGTASCSSPGLFLF